MTSTEVRIAGVLKRIDKLNTKIMRLKNLIQKKKERIESGKEENNKYPNGEYFLDGDIYWHKDDIRRAEIDLREEKIKLEGYYSKKREEDKKKGKIQNVEAIEEFLNQWKTDAINWYMKELKKIRDSLNNLKGNDLCEKISKAKSNYDPLVFRIWQTYKTKEEQQEEIDKFVTRDIENKKIDLYVRCSEIAGIISDATGLYIEQGTLNGIVIGDKGKAKIQTIYAGGHNVQCFHYRILIHKI